MKGVLPFLNNPKDLNLSYKTDLDLWDCFGMKNLCLITEEIQYLFGYKMGDYPPKINIKYGIQSREILIYDVFSPFLHIPTSKV